MIVVIWLVAVTISLPLAIYQHLVWIDDDDSAAGFYSCEENWPGPESRRIFTVISNVLQRRQLDNNDAIYINTDINYDDIYTDICHSDRRTTKTTVTVTTTTTTTTELSTAITSKPILRRKRLKRQFQQQ